VTVSDFSSLARCYAELMAWLAQKETVAKTQPSPCVAMLLFQQPIESTMVFKHSAMNPNESLQEFLDRAETSYFENAHLEAYQRILQTLRRTKPVPAEAQLLPLLVQWRPNDLVWSQVHLLQLLEIDPQEVEGFNKWWIQFAPATQKMEAGLSEIDVRRWKILNMVSKLSLDFVIADTAGNMKFAIELDGLSHGEDSTQQQQRNDEIKDFVLRHIGVPLLRVQNNEVFDPTLLQSLQQRIQSM